MTRWLLVSLVLLLGCKDRGTVDIALEFPDSCEPASHVAIYLVRGATCGDCACGDCLDICSGPDCTLGCDDGYCPIEELESGIPIVPDRAGSYAIIYQLVDLDPDGIAREVASACADNIVLDKDGTSDQSIDATGVCCPGS